MAVQRRWNWISQARVDTPAMRAVESAASNDWDQGMQSVFTGVGSTLLSGSGYVLRGFNINITGAIGGAANALQMEVDPGALLHVTASQSGTVFEVPQGTPAQVLNGSINATVSGAFAPNAINYVGIDYTRFLDTTTDTQFYLWDPTSNSQTTLTAPSAMILTYEIVITTTSWASNVLPIAIVETDALNNVTSITDARWMLFRLGSGGSTPNPFYVYPWPEGRVEDPSTSTSGNDPFYGGDKGIMTMKDWMNAVMSALLEIKGTPYWYSAESAGSITTLREDTALTVVTGNSTISHGILPNTTPVLVTTGNTTTSSNQLTSLALTTGIVPGLVVIGSGIPTGTTVLSILSNTVTLSQNVTTGNTGVTVYFYAPEQVTAPGQINWASNPPGDGQIYLKLVGSQLDYQIAENPTGATVTLSDNEVAYLSLTRNVAITPNLIWVNGSPTVTSVGNVTWTTGIQAGDWVRQNGDPDSLYYQILTVVNPYTVTLTENYGGSSNSNSPSVYAFGTYTLPGVTSTLRDIQLADRASVPLNSNTVWLFLRSDDGGSVPRVYIKFLGAELQQGDAEQISGPQLNNVLQYIGSPTESAIAPDYTATVFPSPVPEISQITVGPAAAMASNQYFYIFSSGNYRSYYVWVNKDGTGVDPMPFANYIGIPWVIATGQTSTQTANALTVALNGITPNDFSASYVGAVVTVTNNSAGVTNATANFNVGGLSASTTQAGTGFGNAVINDGDNLTLAIKKLDDEFGNFIDALDSPTYDENILIVASGGQSPPYYGSGFPDFTPVQLNGPISEPAYITIPNNTRLSNVVQKYTVGKGSLEVYLNGQYLELGVDWLEVGAANSASTQIQILQNLLVGDTLEFRIGTGGGGGGGGGIGPEGPQGPQGPAGMNSAGGPVAISTKSGPTTYTVLVTDCFLRADCTSGTVTFTLPDATLVGNLGRIFYFKKVDSTSNSMILQPTGGQLIDGQTSQFTVRQYQEFSLIANGVGWDNF